MIPAEAPVCEADDELHVRHDVGSKQLAVHPVTDGLATKTQAEDQVGKGGGEGEVFCDSRITLGPYLRDVMYKWSLIESIPQIWTTLLLDVA